MDCNTPGFPVLHYLQSLLKLMFIESVMLSNNLILYHPFLFCFQSFPASGSFPMSLLFASGGQNVGSFSFIISASNEYSRLISFRIDWFDGLTVQGNLKSLLQHHNSKAEILWAKPSVWSNSYTCTCLLEKP